MSKLMRAQELWAIAKDEGRNRAERLAAVTELCTLKKQAKVGWGKLGLEDGAAEALRAQLEGEDFTEATPEELAAQRGRPKEEEEDDPLDEKPAAEPKPAVKPAAKPKPAKAKKEADDERGQISAMVRGLLLTTDKPYSEIEELVRAKHPKARTTTRSIASVASDLRGRGETVATRRAAAKPKGGK